MKILVVNPDYSGNTSTFPIGLAYIVAMIREAGYSIDVLDIPGLGLNRRQVENWFSEGRNYDVIAIGSLISNFGYMEWLLQVFRQNVPNAEIILGGGMPSSMPEFVMENLKPDYIVLGEGEYRILELLNAIDQGSGFDLLKGVGYWQGDSYVIEKTIEEIPDLDVIPFPAWDLFPMDKYFHNTIPGWDIKVLPVITSRSCPFPCYHCAHTAGKKTRLRSAENVVDELQELVERFGIEGVKFYDELFTVDRKRVKKICDLIVERGIQLQWHCTNRSDLADYELYLEMKSAGCKLITYGIESGNDQVLKLLRKGTTTEKNSRAIEITRKAGIEPDCNFMLGMPGENHQSIQDTVDFIKRHKLFVVDFPITTPYPDSPAFLDLVAQGKIPDMKKFLFSLGEANVLTYNLSELPDTQLIEARNEALQDLYMYYLKSLVPAERIENGSRTLSCTVCGEKIVPDKTKDTILTQYTCPVCKKVFFLDLSEFPKAEKNLMMLKKKLTDLKEKNKKNLGLYCAGTHTVRLLMDIDLEGFNVSIIDSNINKSGKRFFDYHIYSLDQAASELDLDAIVISSYSFSEIIYNDLLKSDLKKCEIVKIYN